MPNTSEVNTNEAKRTEASERVERKRRKRSVRFDLDEELYELYAAAARSIGSTVNDWAKHAMASYYGKWKSPGEMRKKKGGKDPGAAGRWCARCDVDAVACLLPEIHKQWGEWV